MQSAALVVVTGATGLIGSHVAEAARQRGYRVRALLRQSSRLEGDVADEVLHGSLEDRAFLGDALKGAKAIIHCAAKVGDWGDAEEYRRVNFELVQTLTLASEKAGLERFVLLSSLGVYEARDHFGTDESVEPDYVGLDPYTRTKAESERWVLERSRAGGIPAVAIRPGFVYGPRDRTVMPTLLAQLAARRVVYFGSGEQLLNSIYVKNVAAAVMAALERHDVAGEAFNVTDDPKVSRRVFFEEVARLAGLPPPKIHVPRPLARLASQTLDAAGKLLRLEEPPLLSKARYKFLALHLDYSIDKAKSRLGYEPPFSFEQGMAETIAWFRMRGALP